MVVNKMKALMELEPKVAPRAEAEALKEAEIEVAEAFEALVHAIRDLKLRGEEMGEIETHLVKLYQSLGGVIE